MSETSLQDFRFKSEWKPACVLSRGLDGCVSCLRLRLVIMAGIVEQPL